MNACVACPEVILRLREPPSGRSRPTARFRPKTVPKATPEPITSVNASLFNALTSDSLLDKVEELLPKHRERLYPPTETLSMFLSQAMNSDRSCQNSVNKSVIHRVGDGLSICSTKTGGYCRARKRLPNEMVSELTRHLGSMIDEQTIELWCWKRRRVRIVDGTTVTMPDTPSNQAAYPQQKGQR